MFVDADVETNSTTIAIDVATIETGEEPTRIARFVAGKSVEGDAVGGGTNDGSIHEVADFKIGVRRNAIESLVFDH